jgi:ArsR family transcriptional regulator, virulence genes transcriptional regulator
MDKNNFYLFHADVCKTISNPRRQAILDSLRDKELTVKEIADRTGITQANLSQHLSILRSKGVLLSRKQGNHVFYSISTPKIMKAYDLISEAIQEILGEQKKIMDEQE